MRAYVYQLLDAEGTVIYVGRTEHIANRIAAHRRKPWWRDVARIESEVFDSKGKFIDVRRMSSRAEGQLIRELQPVHNFKLTDKDKDPGGHATRRAHLAGEPCPNPRCGIHRIAS
jgi:excinuclease UvrABC nuclease subunit